ncbi:MAG: hypothetical protein IIC83_01385 [Chloroflexi bacterium]|nr:hypothetical protein [Chloroflexota bacterium]
MTKWWVIAFTLVLFAAAGCNIVASAITSRGVGAADRDELGFSRLPDSRVFQTNQSQAVNPPDPSRGLGEILTPLAVQELVSQAGPIAAGPAASGPAVDAAPANPEEPASKFPDVTLTIEPTRTPAAASVPTPEAEESLIVELPQAVSTVTISEDLPTPEPRQACIHPGGTTLWLETSDGQWSVPVGQSIEVNLCLSNISVDLAGFDVLLELGPTGTAEFRGISMGGFGLESYSELPTESLRIRAIDLKQRLTAGTDGVILATMQVAGVAVGVSPMAIGLNAIDDIEGNSVAAVVVDSSLRVTLP